MSNHTPGPWKAEYRHGTIEILTDSRPIARGLYHIGSEDPEVWDNAQLIAAAPELLEALQEIVKWFSFSRPFKPDVQYAFINPDGANEAMRKAWEAIIKAEGRLQKTCFLQFCTP